MSEIDAYIRRFHEHGYRDSDLEVFTAAWDRLEASYLERLAEFCLYDHWTGRFRAGARETLRLVETAPAAARFMVVDSLLAGEVGRRRQRQLRTRLAVLVDSAREEVEEADHVPPATAPWIISTFFDRIYRCLTGCSATSLQAQLPELMFLSTSAYFGTEKGLSELVDRD
jgi:hypothetical protein